MQSLHWEGHDNAIISEVARFYRDGVNVDCSFLIDGQFLKGHKVILCACSPYFQELFKWRSGKNPIPLKNVSYNDMKYILSYMYNGVVDVPLNEFESFINVSKSFQIRGLEKLYNPKKLDIIANKYKNGNNREEPSTNKENSVNYQEPYVISDSPAQKSSVDCQAVNNCGNEISFIGSRSGSTQNEFQSTTNEGNVNRVKIKQEVQNIGNSRSWAPPSKHFASEQHGSNENEHFWRFLEEIGLQTKGSSNNETQNDKSGSSVSNVAVERERFLRERHALLPMQFLQVNIGESSSTSGQSINGHKLKEARVVLERIDVTKLGADPQVNHKNSSECNEKKPKRMKSTKERFPCIYCFASYTNRNVLQEHLITHTGEDQFLCQDCYFAFPTRLDLVTHREKHMEEERRLKGIPDVPPTTFERNRYPSLPESKIEGDDGDPDGRRFRCQFCSTEFAHRGHLRVHLRTHTGEKPFQCRYCSMAFARKWNLKCHIRSHLGEKAYTCQNCPAAFAKRESLVKHRIICPEKKDNVLPLCKDQKINVSSPCDEQKVNELSLSGEPKVDELSLCDEPKVNVLPLCDEQKVNVLSPCNEQKVSASPVDPDQEPQMQSSFNEQRVDLSLHDKEKGNVQSSISSHEQGNGNVPSSCEASQNNISLCESRNANTMPLYGQQKTNVLPLCDLRNTNPVPLYEGHKSNVLSVGEGQKSHTLPMHEGQNSNTLPLYDGQKGLHLLPMREGQNSNSLPLAEGQKTNVIQLCEAPNPNALSLYERQKANDLSLCQGQNPNMLPLYGGQKSNVFPLYQGQNINMLPMYQGQKSNMLLFCEGQNNMVPLYEGQKVNSLPLYEGHKVHPMSLCEGQNVRM